jgi:hypothetical protein
LRDGQRRLGRCSDGAGRFLRLFRAQAEDRFGLILHAGGFVLRFSQQPSDAVFALGPDLGGSLARREEHPHGLLPQLRGELYLVGMRGVLGPGLRGLELGPQRGLTVSGLAQVVGDAFEEDPYLVGVVAAETRRKGRTRDGIGTEARRTTLGVAIGSHSFDRTTGHPPGGRPPGRPPSRSFTFLTIPSTTGEPVGGTRVVVGGLVGGGVVGVGPLGCVVGVVVEPPPPVVGDAVVAVGGACAARANWNWVALRASCMAERSGLLATP